MDKFCPLIKEKCKGEECTLMEWSGECLIAEGLKAIGNINSELVNINSKLKGIMTAIYQVSED